MYPVPVSYYSSCKLVDQTPIGQHGYKMLVTLLTYATLFNLLLMILSANSSQALVNTNIKTDCF